MDFNMKYICTYNETLMLQKIFLFFFLFSFEGGGSDQGLLLKIKKFSKTFDKDRSIRHTMYKKGLKFALVDELAY